MSFVRHACTRGRLRVWGLAALLASLLVSLGCAMGGLSALAGVVPGAVGVVILVLSSVSGCDCGYRSRPADGDDSVGDSGDDGYTDSCLDVDADDGYSYCLDVDTDTGSDTSWCLDYYYPPDAGTDGGADSGPRDAGDAAPDSSICLSSEPPPGSPAPSSRAPQIERARALDRVADRGTLPADVIERIRKLRG